MPLLTHLKDFVDSCSYAESGHSGRATVNASVFVGFFLGGGTMLL